ncbi:MAG: TetR/AcrR family transcriptional regulator [Kiritimatiellia bacterium]
MNTDSSKSKAPPSQKDLRKERERETHRLAITRAAETVFSRKGFHGATVEEIAHEAGFAVGTLYNFFKSKDELYASVIVSHHETLLPRFDAIIAGPASPSKTITALTDLILANFSEHKEFIRIFFESSSGGPNAAAKHPGAELRRFHAHYTESLRDLFRKGVRIREFVELDPLLLAFCYEGFIGALVRYWAAGDFKEPLATLTQKARATLKTFLVAKGAPP